VSTNAVESTGGSAARQESECSSMGFCNSESHSWIGASGLQGLMLCQHADVMIAAAVRASCFILAKATRPPTTKTGAGSLSKQGEKLGPTPLFQPFLALINFGSRGPSP
jgi:hypothetical protein